MRLSKKNGDIVAHDIPLFMAALIKKRAVPSGAKAIIKSSDSKYFQGLADGIDMMSQSGFDGHANNDISVLIRIVEALKSGFILVEFDQ